jgi:hypothetical protein
MPSSSRRLHLVAPTFCDVEVKIFFLKRFDHVRIYGVTDKGQQDSIVRSLERSREQSKTRRLVADFDEKENWRTWSDPTTGSRGGERGPETPIRKVVIKQHAGHANAIHKLVTRETAGEKVRIINLCLCLGAGRSAYNGLADRC